MIAAWIQRFLSEDKLWYHLHLSFKRGPHVPWFTGEGMLTTVGTVLFSAALTIKVLFTSVAVLVSLFVLFCVFRPFVIIIKILFSYYKVSCCHCFEATGIFFCLFVLLSSELVSCHSCKSCCLTCFFVESVPNQHQGFMRDE